MNPNDAYALAWAALIGGFLIWRRPSPRGRIAMEIVWDTVLIMIAITILILEAYAKLTSSPTLSQMIWRWSRLYPLLPWWFVLVWAALMIHWFGSDTGKDQ